MLEEIADSGMDGYDFDYHVKNHPETDGDDHGIKAFTAEKFLDIAHFFSSFL